MHRLNNLWSKVANARVVRRFLLPTVFTLVMLVVYLTLRRLTNIWIGITFTIAASAGEAAVIVLTLKLGIKKEPGDRAPKARAKSWNTANHIVFTSFLIGSVAFLLYEAGLPFDLVIGIWAAAILVAAVSIVTKRFEPGRLTAGSVAAMTTLIGGSFAYLATDYGVPPVAALVGWALLSLVAVAFTVKKRDELERVWIAMREARDSARSNI